jgi:NADH-quinone oxidoreductase subunit F
MAGSGGVVVLDEDTDIVRLAMRTILAKNMLGRTFCALGDAAAMPTIGFIEKFRDEFEAHLLKTQDPQAPELIVV